MTETDEEPAEQAMLLGRLFAFDLIIRHLLEVSDYEEEILRDALRSLDELEATPGAEELRAAYTHARAHIKRIQSRT